MWFNCKLPHFCAVLSHRRLLSKMATAKSNRPRPFILFSHRKWRYLFFQRKSCDGTDRESPNQNTCTYCNFYWRVSELAKKFSLPFVLQSWSQGPAHQVLVKLVKSFILQLTYLQTKLYPPNRFEDLWWSRRLRLGATGLNHVIVAGQKATDF